MFVYVLTLASMLYTAVPVQDFGLPRSSSHAAFSGVASPHSGMATPTAAGAPAGLFSPGPGGFFGGGSLAMRHGSMQALGEALSLGMRSGEGRCGLGSPSSYLLFGASLGRNALAPMGRHGHLFAAMVHVPCVALLCHPDQ
jgi:hypothetical protein